MGKAQSKPMRRIEVNGQVYDSLCDTGACTTVLRAPPPGVRWSTKAVWIRSASGRITQSHLTDPIQIQDVETGREATLSIIVDSQCPVDLIGRDLLLALKIGLFPSENGMCSEAFVHEAAHSPNYYWTLDLVHPRVKRELLNMIRNRTERPVEYQQENRLHCTMWYKHIPGPDPNYDERIHTLQGQRLALNYVYIFRDGSAAVAVNLHISHWQKHVVGNGKIQRSCSYKRKGHAGT